MTKTEIVSESSKLLASLTKAVNEGSFKQAGNIAENLAKTLGDYLSAVRIKGKCC